MSAEKESYDPARYQLEPSIGAGESITASAIVDLAHAHGSARFGYDPESRIFMILDLWVPHEFRRRGIAQNMLRYSKELAVSLGAEVINATIVSRESLVAFEKAFGDQEDAIEVQKLGRFEEPEPGQLEVEERHTEAFLDYYLERSEPQDHVG